VLYILSRGIFAAQLLGWTNCQEALPVKGDHESTCNETTSDAMWYNLVYNISTQVVTSLTPSRDFIIITIVPDMCKNGLPEKEELCNTMPSVHQSKYGGHRVSGVNGNSTWRYTPEINRKEYGENSALYTLWLGFIAAVLLASERCHWEASSVEPIYGNGEYTITKPMRIQDAMREISQIVFLSIGLWTHLESVRQRNLSTLMVLPK